MQYKFAELVNDDGTPTQQFWALWRKDKEGCKQNNLFLGKEAGQWVVKPGSPRFVVHHNGSTVNSGRCYTLEGAQERVVERVAGFAKQRTPEQMVAIRAAIAIRVEYERPKFGTPQEREARRKEWAQYAEARREEKAAADYRPSRWELNYDPENAQLSA